MIVLKSNKMKLNKAKYLGKIFKEYKAINYK